VREAADKLQVATFAIYRLCKSGELPHVRIIETIRIRPVDLDAFVAARRQRGDAARDDP
jgi:excisionase family DNA binding protein